VSFDVFKLVVDDDDAASTTLTRPYSPDAGYKSDYNPYMMYQSFYVDVDEANTWLQVLLRNDDAAVEVRLTS
jgi:hypothetical protein